MKSLTSILVVLVVVALIQSTMGHKKQKQCRIVKKLLDNGVIPDYFQRPPQQPLKVSIYSK
jgi:myo-inositol catabolism protein IolC